MVKVITWRLVFLSCPGHWTLLPWITTAKVHRGFAFTWLFSVCQGSLSWSRRVMSDLASRVEAMQARELAKSSARREAIAERLAAEGVERERRRCELRETMPRTAAFVDAVRSVFGEGVRVLAAREGDKSVVNRAACERARVDWRAYVQD